MEKYTTAELKAADSLLDKDKQTEQDKTIITNEAYAICDFINQLLQAQGRR